jgi:hypothetical protein
MSLSMNNVPMDIDVELRPMYVISRNVCMGWTYEDFLSCDEAFTIIHREVILYDMRRSAYLMEMHDTYIPKIDYILMMLDHGVSPDSIIRRYPNHSSIIKIISSVHGSVKDSL